jgi:hypothetical protein
MTEFSEFISVWKSAESETIPKFLSSAGLQKIIATVNRISHYKITSSI